MPYLNEHAARIREPHEFEKDSFRRENNKFGDGIHVIFARLLGDGNKMTVQAIRFDAQKFSEKKAKDWLRENGYEYIIFEPAISSAKKHSVPAGAMTFTIGEFSLGDNGENAKSAPVTMRIRSGGAIDHWFWGRVIHDASGMRLAKNRIAVDYNHNPDEIIGYLNHFEADNSGNMIARGALCPYRDNDRASEVIAKMRAGVPYEASIFFGGEDTYCEQVDDGQTAEVNGYTVSGPATIFRSWTLRGVAVCPYGADMHTRAEVEKMASVFCVGDLRKGEIMEKEEKEKEPEGEEKSVEPVDGAEEKAADVKADGAKFMAAFGRERGAVWFAEGLSFEEAREKFIAEIGEENKRLREELAQAQQRLSALENAGALPAKVGADAPAQHSFLDLARARMAEKKITMRQACAEIARENPALFAEYRKGKK